MACVVFSSAMLSTATPRVEAFGDVTPLPRSGDIVSGQWLVPIDAQYQERLLFVGDNGFGSLSISDGGQVLDHAAYIGFQSSGLGQVSVTGQGSEWLNSGPLVLGQSGFGHLDLDSGAYVSSRSAQLGGGYTGLGELEITGASSKWLVQNDLTVGGLGTAVVEIRAEGRLVSDQTQVGEQPGSLGVITVTGAGSLFAGNGSLTLGLQGEGILQIYDGAVVTSKEGTLASSGSASGTVLLTGAGSRWSNYAGPLYIGGDATAAGGHALIDMGAGTAVEADEMILWQQGIIQGEGQVVARNGMISYGTLRPGYGIGILSINGDLQLSPDSVLEVEVDDQGQSDLVQVTGTADLGGTLRTISTETITQPQFYTILEADQVLGQFDIVDMALLDVSLSSVNPLLGYQTDRVTLRVQPLTFDDPALTTTQNQAAVGGALQCIAEEGGNDITAQLQQLMEPAQVRQAYDQLSGMSRTSVAPMTSNSTGRFLGAVSGRLNQARRRLSKMKQPPPMYALNGSVQAGGVDSVYDVNPLGPTLSAGNGSRLFGDEAWGVWGKGYGLVGDRENQPDAVGYGYDVWGAGVGLDYQFANTCLLGITGGYSHGDIDYVDTSATLFDGLYGALYTTYEWTQWYLDGIVTLASLGYEGERHVNVGGSPETLVSDYNGHEVSTYVETGFYGDGLWGWTYQPLVALRYSHVALDDYTETGGSAALSYGEQTYDSLRSSLGIKFNQDVLRAVSEHRGDIQLRLRWNHEFQDNESTVDTSFASNPGTVFTVSDEHLPRDSGVLGIGFHLYTRRAIRFRLDYDTRFSSEDQDHLITGQMEYRW
jgi:T5SS/PEP-CTERM-associated repeat protein